MSAALRLLICCVLVVGSTGTIATAVAPDPHDMPATLPLEPGDAEWLGTWSGTIAVDGLTEPFDGGYIAIERAPDDRFGVTVGPVAEVRHQGVRLERTEHGLRFEVSLPGFETRLLVYDVAINHGTMTGTVTFVRHRLTKPGRLDFLRK